MNNRSNKLNRLVLPLVIIGGVLVIFAFVFAFTVTPLVSGEAATNGFLVIGGQYVTNKLLLSQKIFYFHMPAAIVSMVALVFTAVYAILFLKTRNDKYDMRARTATEVSLVFVIMTMASGEAWERYDWGIWWTWDPRLTTYLILMLMVFAYFVLRTAVSDPERRAVYSSVFGIIVFINVPICFMVTRLIPSSIHPVVFSTDSGLPPLMLVPLFAAMLGFGCLAFAFYRQRLRTLQMKERIETLKMRLDDLEEMRG